MKYTLVIGGVIFRLFGSLIFSLLIIYQLLSFQDDKHSLATFWSWLIYACLGDLGTSSTYRMGVPVWELLVSRVYTSTRIIGAAVLMWSILTLLLVWWLNKFKNQKKGLFCLYVIFSVPSFMIAFWFIRLFNTTLYELLRLELLEIPPIWFPLPRSDGALRFWLASTSLVLSDSCLTKGVRSITAEFSRLQKTEYAALAKMYGARDFMFMSNGIVLIFFTIMINRLIYWMGVVIIVESIFHLPGLGELTWASIIKRDIPLVMGVTLVWGATYGALRLVIDVLEIIFDPRQRERREVFV